MNQNQASCFAVIDLSKGGFLGGEIVKGYAWSADELVYKHRDLADNMASHLNHCNETTRYAVRPIY